MVKKVFFIGIFFLMTFQAAMISYAEDDIWLEIYKRVESNDQVTYQFDFTIKNYSLNLDGATLIFPNNESKNVIRINNFIFSDNFLSQSELETKYPAGTYTIELRYINGTIVQETANLDYLQNPFPATPQYKFWPDGRTGVSLTPTIRWEDSWSSGEDIEAMQLYIKHNHEIVHTVNVRDHLNWGTSYTIPPGVLEPDSDYLFYLLPAYSPDPGNHSVGLYTSKYVRFTTGLGCTNGEYRDLRFLDANPAPSLGTLMGPLDDSDNPAPLIAKNGDKLEIRWFGPIPHYEMLYYPSGSSERRLVGACHFQCGINYASYVAVYENPADSQPVRFCFTLWKSIDGGGDDRTISHPSNGLLDLYTYSTDFSTEEVSHLHYKYEYAEGHPPTGEEADCETFDPKYGQLIEYEWVDPPLGPESDAMFNSFLDELQKFSPNEISMKNAKPDICDINLDGLCNPEDYKVASESIGTCEGDIGYQPMADINVDGCITEEDLKYSFSTIPTPLSDMGTLFLLLMERPLTNEK